VVFVDDAVDVEQVGAAVAAAAHRVSRHLH
jgi:hypothetical protein